MSLKKRLRQSGAWATLLVASLPISAQQKPAKPTNFHAWAATPPMGWNSWDCYGSSVTEAEVKANADYMAKNLKSFGWEYVVVDIRWYVGNDGAHGYNEKDPDYTLDAHGRFMPAINRFPSAAGGKGFKPLADYLHAKGLKFGLHIMRGVPVEAVKRRLPILGSRATAADIYSPDEQCKWLHDMYTVEAGRPGAQEYYNSLFALYASWDLDFVKVDDLARPYHAAEIELIRKAIDRTGRKIVLSMSPGETPIADAPHARQHANMWRTVDDLWDQWEPVKDHFAVCQRWAPYLGPGAYPDADMLPLGRLAIRAERGDDRPSRLTPDEQRLMLTLWSIFRSPLMFGGDLPSNDAATLALLTNKNVLAVNQRSTHNRQLFRRGDLIGWTADIPDSPDKYLALFNATDQQPAPAADAAWVSGPLTREQFSAPIDVPLNGATRLSLMVRDGGDGNSRDYADWLNPVLTNGAKTLDLTTVPWLSATTEREKVQVNKTILGRPLTAGGQPYEKGLGTYANSLITYELPAGYTHFRATAALDGAAGKPNPDTPSGTVQFLVFTKPPMLPMPPDSVRVPVALQTLGFASGARVQDLWTGKNLGAIGPEFAPFIRRHGAGLYRLSPLAKSGKTSKAKLGIKK